MSGNVCSDTTLSALRVHTVFRGHFSLIRGHFEVAPQPGTHKEGQNESKCFKFFLHTFFGSLQFVHPVRDTSPVTEHASLHSKHMSRCKNMARARLGVANNMHLLSCK